jgi:hypothetical protein
LDKFETVIKIIFYFTSSVITIAAAFSKKERVEKKIDILTAGMIWIMGRLI